MSKASGSMADGGSRKLLHIDSSILGERSASRALSGEIVSRWQAAEPGLEIMYRDLAVEPFSHFSGSSLARSDAGEAARDARALEEFLTADVIVIGAPMYNFTVPTQLKAWIDRGAGLDSGAADIGRLMRPGGCR